MNCCPAPDRAMPDVRGGGGPSANRPLQLSTRRSRRYSEQEISALRQQMQWRVYWLRSRDRFGDNGIVGVAIAKLDATTCLIDTLLLSCRVIGRTVETAMLAYLCERARELGATTVTGTIIPTPKNEPVRDLFSRHSFARIDGDADGTSRWRLDLKDGCVAWPEWFERSIETAASAIGD